MCEMMRGTRELVSKPQHYKHIPEHIFLNIYINNVVSFQLVTIDNDLDAFDSFVLSVLLLMCETSD